MTFLVALSILEKYGPAALALGQHLAANIAAGRGNQPLTDADWAELTRLSSQTSDDIYKRLGITPPQAQ